MFKFKIIYFVKENDGDSEREATVFAENRDRAVEKIKEADPDYKEICSLEMKEYPHWRKDA
ncbi:MAG: hypothetical protein IKM48_08630 [Clostridia bacterium]|nr:hypothetical protein [Clostridia bacterium]